MSSLKRVLHLMGQVPVGKQTVLYVPVGKQTKYYTSTEWIPINLPKLITVISRRLKKSSKPIQAFDNPKKNNT